MRYNYPLIVSSALFLMASHATAQESPAVLPFAPGEKLTYKAQVGALGSLGSATMSVSGPEQHRGVESWLLNFHYRGKLTLFTIEDVTNSWIDPLSMSSLRYEKRERSPLSSSREEVELHSARMMWRGYKGDSGVMPTEAPLDELSFIYFIRTLPLSDTLQHSFNRHFNLDRNPVRITVLRREKLEVPAGTFNAILVEMIVRDEKRYGGDGRVLIHISDDAARLPLRIESSIKLAGAMVLTLSSHTPGARSGATATIPPAFTPRR